MPFYQYRCTNEDCKAHKDGVIKELVQKMDDKHEATCEVCGKSMQRIYGDFLPNFKGSGFHVNDYPHS